LKFFCDVR